MQKPDTVHRNNSCRFVESTMWIFQPKSDSRMSKPTPEALELVKGLMTLPDNQLCADCQRKAAKWASATLGVFICIDCSGIHRDLGAHISFVRSCTLDSWTMDQARIMRRVGNSKANAYYEAHLPPEFCRPMTGDRAGMARFIYSKYVEKRWASAGDPPQLARQQPRQQKRMVVSQSTDAVQLPPPTHDLSQSSTHTNDLPRNVPNQLPFETPKQQTPPRTHSSKPVMPQMNRSPASPAAPVAMDHSPMPAPKRPDAQEIISIQNRGHVPQHLFGKRSGRARFAKKATGEDVLDGMMSGPRFGAVSAPVQQVAPPPQVFSRAMGSNDSSDELVPPQYQQPPRPAILDHAPQDAPNPFAGDGSIFGDLNVAQPPEQTSMFDGMAIQQPQETESPEEGSLFSGLSVQAASPGSFSRHSPSPPPAAAPEVSMQNPFGIVVEAEQPTPNITMFDGLTLNH